jgi:hypothetical protein
MPDTNVKASRKRKADDSHDVRYPFIGNTAWIDYCEEHEIEATMMNPTTVRNSINRLLENGGVKVGDFHRTLGCSSKSYYDFMHQSGKRGMGSSTYSNACLLFAYMKAIKVPIPKKPRTTAPPATASASASASASAAAPAAATGTTKKATKTSTAVHDISAITLPKELDNKVPVFDTCDEIRRKISHHMRKPDVTGAAFLRDLVQQLHGDKRPKVLQGSQLASFREKKGPKAGATSPVFYASYVFFEKERLAAGGPKTKHREQMERVWAGKGFDLEDDGRGGYWCRGDERAYIDSFGQVSFLKRR